MNTRAPDLDLRCPCSLERPLLDSNYPENWEVSVLGVLADLFPTPLPLEEAGKTCRSSSRTRPTCPNMSCPAFQPEMRGPQRFLTTGVWTKNIVNRKGMAVLTKHGTYFHHRTVMKRIIIDATSWYKELLRKRVLRTHQSTVTSLVKKMNSKLSTVKCGNLKRVTQWIFTYVHTYVSPPKSEYKTLLSLPKVLSCP